MLEYFINFSHLAFPPNDFSSLCIDLVALAGEAGLVVAPHDANDDPTLVPIPDPGPVPVHTPGTENGDASLTPTHALPLRPTTKKKRHVPDPGRGNGNETRSPGLVPVPSLLSKTKNKTRRRSDLHLLPPRSTTWMKMIQREARKMEVLQGSLTQGPPLLELMRSAPV